MNEDKDVLPENDNGELYGYCEEYWANDQLAWKGIMFNGVVCGYSPSYNDDGSIDKHETGYYLDNIKISDTNEEGNCYIWRKVVV